MLLVYYWTVSLTNRFQTD